MHSSASGAAARMVFRSFSSAARVSSFNPARYSSMVLALVLGVGAVAAPPGRQRQRAINKVRVRPAQNRNMQLMTAKLARFSVLCRGAESPQRARRIPKKGELVSLCVYGVLCGQSAANQARAARTKWALVAIGLLFAFVDGASAQTAPLPGISIGDRTGFLSRMAFFLSVAGMQTEDPRFSLAQRGRADLDLFSYRKGRINFLVDTDLVMGSERRAFDLNQTNVIFETSASYRLGPVDVAAVAHHVSRHVVDREF